MVGESTYVMNHSFSFADTCHSQTYLSPSMRHLDENFAEARTCHFFGFSLSQTFQYRFGHFKIVSDFEIILAK